MATHYIHSQRLQLEAANLDSSAAGAWYRKLEQIHLRELLPALERQLDQIGSGEETILIERLEVEVELERLEELEKRLAERLQTELKRTKQQADFSGKKAHLITPDLLIHYLETGNFSWQIGEPVNWLVELEESLNTWTKQHWEALTRALAANFEARFFRLSQVSTSCLYGCLDFLKLSETSAESHFTPSIISRKDGNVKAQLRAHLDLLGFSTTEQAASTQAADIAEDVLFSTEFNHSAALEQAREGYFIPNAGLIILHPYLDYLAKQTKCIDSRGDLDRKRFAGILQYCLAKDAAFQEWEHPLTKLLLGLTPTAPLQGVSISQADKQSADDLLAGIIEHWQALGSTSVDGLREGFLLRPAKLWQDAAGWHLTVEARAFDVLLAHLPWGIGLVKTPWMQDLLQVDWS
ncbi:MAG: contractile injection system tape measure protein [Bacteroidota bacterium]